MKEPFQAPTLFCQLEDIQASEVCCKKFELGQTLQVNFTKVYSRDIPEDYGE